MLTFATHLSFCKMNKIRPNFNELSRIYNIDRHTLKKHYDAGGLKLEWKENIQAV